MYIHVYSCIHVFLCVLMCNIVLFLPNCFGNVLRSFVLVCLYLSRLVSLVFTLLFFPVDFIIIFNISFLLYRLSVCV